MELYIIRHAETDFNKAGIVQGRGVNTSINAFGQQQARLFYGAYKHIAFDAVYASSLKRTAETIDMFKLQTGHIHTDSALDEISWGRYEGTVPSRDFRDGYLHTINEWQNGNFDARMDEGESVAEVAARMRQFMNQLVTMPYKRVLICTHGRALRIMMATLVHNDLRTVEQFEHHNTGLYILHYNDGVYNLMRQNDITHLEPLKQYA